MTETARTPPAARPPNALRVPAFRNLWINNALYMLVLNAQRFTFGWFVLDGLGRDEVWQGVATFALGIPLALFILQTGAWADRYNRKALLVIGQIGTFAVLAATAALVIADAMTLTLLLVLAFAFGVAQTVGQPVRISLIPALVSPEQLFSAIAVNAIAITLSMVLGPVLFQAIGDSLGFEGAFASQAALMAVGLVALIPLRVPSEHQQRRRARRRAGQHQTAAGRGVCPREVERPSGPVVHLAERGQFHRQPRGDGHAAGPGEGRARS